MITLSTSTQKGTNDIFQRLKMMEGFDIDAIELGAMHDKVRDLKKLYSRLADVQKDLIVHCFFPPADVPFMVNIAAKPGPVLKNSLRQIRNSLEFCEKIEAKLYTMHPGTVDESENEEDKEKAFSRFLENYGYVHDLSQDYDVPVAVENSNRAARHFLYDPEHIQSALREYPKMRLLIDIGHLKLASIDAGFDIRDFISRFQDSVSELHIHDNDGKSDQHLPPKSDSILSMFRKDILQNSYLTLEGQKNWDDSQVKDSIAFLRKMI